MRKQYSAKFKSKVALEAAKEEQTAAQLSAKFGVHRVQIQQWKKRLREDSEQIFGSSSNVDIKKLNRTIDELHRLLGESRAENEWLKNSSKANHRR